MHLLNYLKKNGYEGSSFEVQLANLEKSAPSLEERIQELSGPSLEERLQALRSTSGQVRYEWPPYLYHRR